MESSSPTVTMNPTVDGAELLTVRFGYWPSFHDAEVVRVRFERSGEDSPFMECQIHVFEMTEEVDEEGFYVLRHHTLENTFWRI